ncbi:MAG: hypothetical protein ACLFQQ_22900 [Desulfococcaceae bacterium]
MELNWKAERSEIVEMMENGAMRLLWQYAGDARIRHDDAPLGVGPAVLTGRPEDPDTGRPATEGVVRDALFLFCDYVVVDSVYAAVFDADPTELQAEIDAYMDAHGGDVDAMRALKPTTT